MVDNGFRRDAVASVKQDLVRVRKGGVEDVWISIVVHIRDEKGMRQYGSGDTAVTGESFVAVVEMNGDMSRSVRDDDVQRGVVVHVGHSHAKRSSIGEERRSVEEHAVSVVEENGRAIVF